MNRGLWFDLMPPECRYANRGLALRHANASQTQNCLAWIKGTASGSFCSRSLPSLIFVVFLSSPPYVRRLTQPSQSAPASQED